MAYPTHGPEYHERNWIKKPCRVATAGALGGTLADGLVVDGVTIATGDRVLVKDAGTTANNGIYLVGPTSSTRAIDFNTESEILGGVMVILEGTVNADTIWICTTDAPITVGTTGLTFTQPIGDIAADIAAHLADTSDAHDASSISFTPAGTISATNVQAAIEEAAAEGGGGGGGGGGWEIQSTTGTKLEAGRTDVWDSDLEAALVLNGDIGIYAGPAGIIELWTDGPGLWLDPGAGDNGRIYTDGADGIVVPVNTSEPSTGDPGEVYLFDGTVANHEQLRAYLGGRWGGVVDGWAPTAYPPNFVATGTYTTAVNLAANGGTMVVPVLVPSWMMVSGVSFWNTDSASARSCEIALYGGDTNVSNSLARLANAEFGSWTPGAASLRGISYGTSTPLILRPGLYWLAIRNDHASNTLGVGTLAASGQIAPNSYQTKTIATALPNPLDLVAATWTKATAIPGVMLRGRVFGQTTSF